MGMRSLFWGSREVTIRVCACVSCACVYRHVKRKPMITPTPIVRTVPIIQATMAPQQPPQPPTHTSHTNTPLSPASAGAAAMRLRASNMTLTDDDAMPLCGHAGDNLSSSGLDSSDGVEGDRDTKPFLRLYGNGLAGVGNGLAGAGKGQLGRVVFGVAQARCARPYMGECTRAHTHTHTQEHAHVALFRGTESTVVDDHTSDASQ